MKFLVLVVFALFSNHFAQAELLQDQVAKVLPGTGHQESLVLLAHSGRVLRSTDSSAAQELNEAALTQATVSFVEERGNLISLAVSTPRNNPILDQYYDSSLPNFSIKTAATDIRYTDQNFIPTNFTSLNDVQKLMDELKFNTKSKSECYQRAHLWSIEMLQMANVQSQKIFLFFTEKYIRDYRFDWWFHVAPFVLVNDQERVLDPQFLDHPSDVQSWINYFMVAHPQCKTVEKYQDYDLHQNEAYCYLRKLPMYYFEPTEVENRDLHNQMIDYWIEDQVGSAYASLNNAPWWKR